MTEQKAIRPPMDIKVVLRWLAIAVSVLWISLASISEFTGVSPEQYGYRDGDVRELLARCEGTFQQRYDCKQRIILEKDRGSFFGLMEKLGIILGPPIILGLLFYLLRRQIERHELPTPSPNLYKNRRKRVEETTRREEIDLSDL